MTSDVGRECGLQFIGRQLMAIAARGKRAEAAAAAVAAQGHSVGPTTSSSLRYASSSSCLPSTVLLSRTRA